MKNTVHKKKFQKLALRKYQNTYVVSVIKVNRFSVIFYLFLRKAPKRLIKAELRLMF